MEFFAVLRLAAVLLHCHTSPAKRVWNDKQRLHYSIPKLSFPFFQMVWVVWIHHEMDIAWKYS
eukprot:481039-Amphidinium_carterae.1